MKVDVVRRYVLGQRDAIAIEDMTARGCCADAPQTLLRDRFAMVVALAHLFVPQSENQQTADDEAACNQNTEASAYAL